jgi:uncharacterized repeat protein (TIGR03803 family)
MRQIHPKTARPYTKLGVLISVLALGLVIASPTQAQKLTTLYNFTGGTDGGSPFSTLAKDKQGNLYGTAFAGGNEQGNCDYDFNYGTGCGTVFELTSSGKNWTLQVIYSFQGSPNDGGNPNYEPLVFDKAGNLYGTTVLGGDFTCLQGSPGCGTVFKLAPSENGWTDTLLYKFTWVNNDGAFPSPGLVFDKKGSLYSTTFNGGSYGFGAVYQITPSGTRNAIYSFTNQADGSGPYGGVVLDKKGNLYGTTSVGGSTACGGGCGTVFKIAPDGTETVLHSFTGGSDGIWPWASVTLDKNGNIYGTTSEGGNTECGGVGCGIVFKIAPDGTETILHQFTYSQDNYSEGGSPRSPMVLDAKGNLYGTTMVGGSTYGGWGCGTVFKIAPDGTETILHAFDNSDGCSPWGVILKGGIVYGTTQAGGSYNWGTVFRLNPNKSK